jgi:hypothetical protein
MHPTITETVIVLVAQEVGLDEKLTPVMFTVCAFVKTGVVHISERKRALRRDFIGGKD